MDIKLISKTYVAFYSNLNRNVYHNEFKDGYSINLTASWLSGSVRSKLFLDESTIIKYLNSSSNIMN